MAGAVLFWMGSALALLSLVLLMAAAAMAIQLQYRMWRYRHLPSAKMLPHWTSYFVGHANQLAKLRTGEATFQEVVRQWMTELGPVFVVHLPTYSHVFVTTKEAVKEFVASGKHSKNPLTYTRLAFILSERFMGKGLITEHHDHIWEPRRRLFNPAFHRNYLKLSMDQFNRSTDDLIQLLTPRADGKTPVKMLEEMTRLTLDVIAKVAFGYDCKSLSEGHSDFQDAFLHTLRGYNMFLTSPWKKYSIFPATVAERKKVRASIKFLREVGREVISDRIESLKRGEDTRNDILSYILTATEKEGQLAMDELVDEFVTFFLAGNETAANTISSMLLHLSQSPDIMLRLQEEVEQVLGKKTSVEFEDLPKLEYMTAVLKETLRISPPGEGTVRKASYDVKINGHLIPKDTAVVVTATMKRAEYFPDPMVFKPERFLNGSIEAHTYTPFSTGPRSCIGQQFAMMEMKVIIAKLLQTFNMTWVPGQSYRFVAEMTEKPRDGALHFLTLKHQTED